jgi:RNA polymerase sigma-70 factor (ECF subfamily)
VSRSTLRSWLQRSIDVSNEQALIDAARQGSAAAYTELVSAYRERLLRFLVTRSASFADAEDALQDTLINAYRYLNSYDSRWRFSTWLFRIAINNANRIRQMDTVEVGELSDEESDPLSLCIAATERENLWQAARRLLTDEVYNAMWLRYVEDMSVKDISAILERSISWTKVNLMRGRKILESELSNVATDRESKAYG